MTRLDADVLVIGAGIAGTSAAAEIAKSYRVVVVEREAQPGYHSTGRSAALFSAVYGNNTVRAFSRASREFLFSPPDGFSAHGLVQKRGCLLIARDEQTPKLRQFLADPDVAANVEGLSAKNLSKLCPLLRPGYAVAGVYEANAVDVDVHALHQGYLRLLRARGGQMIANAEVLRLENEKGLWTVHTTIGELSARVLVNAAGAWADEVAALAGLEPLAIVPCRRTAVLIDPPAGLTVGSLPMTVDIDEQFYFKPEAGKLLLSPADETPSAPCDAQPEEIDVAIAIDRVQTATTIHATRVLRKWAGLRSFAADRSPVIGYDKRTESFFWLGGQGGYGIQTAPAAGLLAAALICEKDVPMSLARFGVNEADVSPRRLMSP